jgi:hypothetical protein
MALLPAPPAAPHPDGNARELKKAQKRALKDEGRRDLDTLRREEAADIAADMEMGYYVPASGEQWPVRPFVVAEVLRRMGYGKWTIANNVHPRWWPGREVFRRVVAWKVAVRRMQSQVDFANKNAWAGPIVGLAVEEMGRRLAANPEKVSDRDITDLITKMTRLFVEGRPGSAPPAGAALAAGAARFTRTTEVFELIDDPREREKMVRDYERSLDEARAAIPARVTPTG